MACRFIEPEILPTARELGIGVVPYRVLADGILSATAKKVPDQSQAQMLAPRLQGDNYDHTMEQVAKLIDIADVKGCAPAQLAVAWLLSQGNDIVPLVGMSRRNRLPENLEILDISLSADELSALDNAFGLDAIRGNQYGPAMMPFVAR